MNNTIQINALILETKLELTHILMSLRSGEDVEDRIIKLIENLQEIPYKNPSL